MFTGIIETLGTVQEIKKEGTNVHFGLTSNIMQELKVDQSVAHNGVCLTVTAVDSNKFWVTAIDETLNKTNLGALEVGSLVNLERCMLINGRFDGHIVQGHVDQVGECVSITQQDGSWLIDIEYDPTLDNVTVEKGSITINGISLTCFNSKDNGFTVAIIPYTFEHTSMKTLNAGDKVNLEFDIVGKYVQRLMNR